MKTAKYSLFSETYNKVVYVTLDRAIAIAIAMESEMQPAWGVQIEDESGKTVADIQNGVDVVRKYYA